MGKEKEIKESIKLSKLIVSERNKNSIYQFTFQMKNDLSVNQNQFMQFPDFQF